MDDVACYCYVSISIHKPIVSHCGTFVKLSIVRFCNVSLLGFWGILLEYFLTIQNGSSKGVVEELQGCFVCNVIMLGKIILYNRSYVRGHCICVGA